MKVIIVNNQDKIIGSKNFSERTAEDIIRVSGLWLLNSNKEVLISQRSTNKAHDPGKWGPSVAGTVEEGESYTSNIIKEAKEELGVSIENENLQSAANSRFVSASHKYFCLTYFAKIDLPISEFSIKKDEVEEVRWIDIKNLSAWLQKNPADFISSFKLAFDELQEFLN